jgi:hypothetical protein
MDPLLKRTNTYLMRWARKKYKRLRGFKRLKAWWKGLCNETPAYSRTEHGHANSTRLDGRSRVTGDCYTRFCESRGLRCPRLLDTAGTPGGAARRAHVVHIPGSGAGIAIRHQPQYTSTPTQRIWPAGHKQLSTPGCVGDGVEKTGPRATRRPMCPAIPRDPGCVSHCGSSAGRRAGQEDLECVGADFAWACERVARVADQDQGAPYASAAGGVAAVENVIVRGALCNSLGTSRRCSSRMFPSGSRQAASPCFWYASY